MNRCTLSARWLGALLCLSPAALAKPPVPAPAQPATSPHEKPAEPHPHAHDHSPPKPQQPKWYDRIRARGYLQVRYNRLGHELGIDKNDDYGVPQDKSVGKGRGFFIRRARLILQGRITDHVDLYFQPDLAGASAGDTQHIMAMRDYYADLSFDKARVYRLRLGQSKLPYGWENLQSSSNRLSLDRSEPINTGSPGERDLGAFFYLAPPEVRARFEKLTNLRLKGSGDYGMLALGVYNGQGVNEREVNENRHVVARFTYPIELGSQTLELGLGGYTGKYRPRLGKGVAAERRDLRDARAHATVVLYPQPLGVQAEYTVGRGPELVGNPLDAASKPTVRERPLHGGYVQMMLRVGMAMPFVRAQYYRGGRKADENAPPADVREIEGGVELQPIEGFELTMTYAVGRRASLAAPYSQQDGRLLRLQTQFSF